MIAIRPENKGKLHRALGVPVDQKIPAGKVAAAKHSPSPALRREDTFAQNASHWKNRPPFKF